MKRFDEALRTRTSTWPDSLTTGMSDATRHDGRREAEEITLKHMLTFLPFNERLKRKNH